MTLNQYIRLLGGEAEAKRHLIAALQKHGTQGKTAMDIGVSRQTLSLWLRVLGIKRRAGADQYI